MSNREAVMRGVETLAEQIDVSQSEVPQGYGLCSRCGHFDYQKTSLGDVVALCDMHRKLAIRPRQDDPITVCSHFYPRGQMSLYDMMGLATLIDVNKKRKAGFLDEVTEVTFSRPEDESDE